jgi:hypothetical protein
MNLNENNDNSNNNDDEITIKIRTMDKEFEINIKKSSTIKELKEKIEQVKKLLFIIIIYIL